MTAFSLFCNYFYYIQRELTLCVQLVSLVQRHDASARSGWSRLPPDMDGTFEFTEYAL
jgi:hypothetical protein